MSNMAENALFSTEPKKGSNKQGQLDSEKEFGKELLLATCPGLTHR